MGVSGLWPLLEPAAGHCDLSKAEGQVLAVDISIWLQQIVKGMRDSRGEMIPNVTQCCRELRFFNTAFRHIGLIIAIVDHVPIAQRSWGYTNANSPVTCFLLGRHIWSDFSRGYASSFILESNRFLFTMGAPRHSSNLLL